MSSEHRQGKTVYSYPLPHLPHGQLGKIGFLQRPGREGSYLSYSQCIHKCPQASVTDHWMVGIASCQLHVSWMVAGPRLSRGRHEPAGSKLAGLQKVLTTSRGSTLRFFSFARVSQPLLAPDQSLLGREAFSGQGQEDRDRWSVESKQGEESRRKPRSSCPPPYPRTIRAAAMRFR